MAYKISDECIACGTCIDECPVEAISEGEIYKIDAEYGIPRFTLIFRIYFYFFHIVCKMLAISIDSGLGLLPDPFTIYKP